MAYVKDGDPRVHLTSGDALAMSEKIVAFVREEAAKGFDVPACNVCVGRAISLAFLTLCADVGKGKHAGEMIGLADTASVNAPLMEEVAGMLVGAGIGAAMQTAGPEALLDLILGLKAGA